MRWALAAVGSSQAAPNVIPSEARMGFRGRNSGGGGATAVSADECVAGKVDGSPTACPDASDVDSTHATTNPGAHRRCGVDGIPPSTPPNDADAASLQDEPDPLHGDHPPNQVLPFHRLNARWNELALP